MEVIDSTNMIKPVVHFLGEPIFYRVELAPVHERVYGNYADDDGCVEYARVHGLDHPILRTDNIRTSIVLKKYDDGSFETMNTLYRPKYDTK